LKPVPIESITAPADAKVVVMGGGITAGGIGSASFEQEKRNTRNANVRCISQVFLNELEELMFI
jgi:hypothetical protein